VLAGIESRVLAAKKSRLTECLGTSSWPKIDALDKAGPQGIALDANPAFFWNFMHEEIELSAIPTSRLFRATGLKHDYEFFGNFVEPKSVFNPPRPVPHPLPKVSGLLYRNCPSYFMNSDLIVDVINLGYNTGVSPKVMGCFACGGLMLFDYKDDFFQSMGEIATSDVPQRGSTSTPGRRVFG